MKNYLGLFLLLCIPLFISCDDDDNGFPSSKDDFSFSGKSLKEVKQAMQGIWLLSNESGEIVNDGQRDHFKIMIDGNKISITSNSTYATLESPRMYDIIWSEVTVNDAWEKMYSFFPKYDDIEVMTYVPYVPYELKDNILKIGTHLGGEVSFIYYKYTYIDYK